MIKIFNDIEELSHFAAEKFRDIANQAIEKQDYFAVALAGGSTPKTLYRILLEKFQNRIDWTKVFVFFTDERNVLPWQEESNFSMFRENLFFISHKNIFSWDTGEQDVIPIAFLYEQDIRKFFKDRNMSPVEVDGKEILFPRFDLILLGMGADGHTASLFPFAQALDEKEMFTFWVYETELERVTLTFPVINNAANVMFLVAGSEKAQALREVLQGEYQPEKFPAQKVKLNDGNLLWLVDSQAARLLQ
jgi:6-phosphogluconolactonase